MLLQPDKHVHMTKGTEESLIALGCQKVAKEAQGFGSDPAYIPVSICL